MSPVFAASRSTPSTVFLISAASSSSERLSGSAVSSPSVALSQILQTIANSCVRARLPCGALLNSFHSRAAIACGPPARLTNCWATSPMCGSLPPPSVTSLSRNSETSIFFATGHLGGRPPHPGAAP